MIPSRVKIALFLNWLSEPKRGHQIKGPIKRKRFSAWKKKQFFIAVSGRVRTTPSFTTSLPLPKFLRLMCQHCLYCTSHPSGSRSNLIWLDLFRIWLFGFPGRVENWGLPDSTFEPFDALIYRTSLPDVFGVRSIFLTLRFQIDIDYLWLALCV